MLQMTVFFSKAKTAVIIGVVLQLCNVFPVFAVSSATTPNLSKVG